jgi:hypothetical protein
MNSAKIINDPVFGFINIPGGLLLNIVKHPWMQRLGRINQLGMAHVVYPGARHTRFQHSLGAFHLTQDAILTLQRKGVFIFDSEAEAVEAAILMHDIGHGPFSHVLEHTLIKGVSHEDISLLMMEQINREMQGQLSLAIQIFRDNYPKRFLHQLISSQLDMDRLDYLCRDSFFTGVTEGAIGSARIIKMLNVADDRLVVEHKGIYSIENFITSRRLMYWQVYLHKTAVAAERLLVSMLRRAKVLTQQGRQLFASPALAYFLQNDVTHDDFATSPTALQTYSELDDSDIWSAMKVWRHHDDRVLSLLASALLDRRLMKVETYDGQTPLPEGRIGQLTEERMKALGLTEEEATYFVDLVTVGKDTYSPSDDQIDILEIDGTLRDIAEVSLLLSEQHLRREPRKHYLCYYRLAT